MSSGTMNRRNIATQFLQLVVAGKIEEAYAKHVDMSGRHHNPFFPAGLPALQKAMMENQVQNPNKRILIKNVLQDQNLVAVHSHLLREPGDKGLAVVHVFRFKRNKIVEFWDVGMILPADSPNTEGAF